MRGGKKVIRTEVRMWKGIRGKERVDDEWEGNGEGKGIKERAGECK